MQLKINATNLCNLMLQDSQESWIEKGRKGHLDLFCKQGVLKKFALYIESLKYTLESLK